MKVLIISTASLIALWVIASMSALDSKYMWTGIEDVDAKFRAGAHGHISMPHDSRLLGSRNPDETHELSSILPCAVST